MNAAYKPPVHPPLIRTGVSLEPFKKPAAPLIEGVHYPKGIREVDLSMMFEQITFRYIASCETDEALRELRTKVQSLLALFDMQEIAKRA